MSLGFHLPQRGDNRVGLLTYVRTECAVGEMGVDSTNRSGPWWRLDGIDDEATTGDPAALIGNASNLESFRYTCGPQSIRETQFKLRPCVENRADEHVTRGATKWIEMDVRHMISDWGVRRHRLSLLAGAMFRQLEHFLPVARVRVTTSRVGLCPARGTYHNVSGHARYLVGGAVSAAS